MTTNVCISQCLHREMNALSARCLMAAMMQSGYRVALPEPEFDALITRSRSIAATRFLEDKQLGEVMVFIDDDISFSVQDFKWLVESCLETKEIVCGLYITRSTANPHPAIGLFAGQEVKIGKTELLQHIKYGATGFMAIHRTVLEKMASEMQLVWSGHRFFYPFFQTIITEENEFLSEDYSFSFVGSELKIKTWLDPRISLGHEGTRTYSVTDMKGDAFTQRVTITIDEGGPDRTDILGDLADYWHKTRKEVYQYLKTASGVKENADAWNAMKPVTADEVENFYKTVDTYILDLAQFNLNPIFWTRNLKANRAVGKVIDFGGGIGTQAIAMWATGRKVTYVDLPSKHRTFAEWRFEKRKADIKVVTSLLELPSGEYDAFVASDVIEHIHPERMPELAREIARVLKEGGQAICVNAFGELDEVPMHFDTQDIWEKALIAAGLVQLSDVWLKPERKLVTA